MENKALENKINDIFINNKKDEIELLEELMITKEYDFNFLKKFIMLCLYNNYTPEKLIRHLKYSNDENDLSKYNDVLQMLKEFKKSSILLSKKLNKSTSYLEEKTFLSIDKFISDNSHNDINSIRVFINDKNLMLASIKIAKFYEEGASSKKKIINLGFVNDFNNYVLNLLKRQIDKDSIKCIDDIFTDEDNDINVWMLTNDEKNVALEIYAKEERHLESIFNLIADFIMTLDKNKCNEDLEQLIINGRKDIKTLKLRY